MRLLYSFSLRLYYAAILLAALAGKQKAQLWLKGRKNWRKSLQEYLPKNKKITWFHVASLGEFEQARPLIEKIKDQDPSTFILLTFFSPSGYEIRKNYDMADHVCYLPLDLPKNASDFVAMVQPQLAIFVKYEFWFNYLHILHKQQIHTVLVSAIFRQSQHFFKAYGSWFRQQLQAFDHFYLQNNTSGDLLQSIGFSNYTINGDTRFDRVIETAKKSWKHPYLDAFCKDSRVAIFGSSWEREHLLAQTLKESRNELKLIIAPHEIDPESMKRLQEKLGAKAILWSKIEQNTELSSYSILIVDSIGLLARMYRYATIAIIGGGFGSGIHNTLEAAVYGIPLLFGPNYRKFKEARELIEAKAAFPVADRKDFLTKASALLDSSALLENSSLAARQYVHQNAGASDRIIQDLTGR
jgi:3-deoxy-D-manno-octulosonic-acid transferase